MCAFEMIKKKNFWSPLKRRRRRRQFNTHDTTTTTIIVVEHFTRACVCVFFLLQYYSKFDNHQMVSSLWMIFFMWTFCENSIFSFYETNNDFNPHIHRDLEILQMHTHTFDHNNNDDDVIMVVVVVIFWPFQLNQSLK